MQRLPSIFTPVHFFFSTQTEVWGGVFYFRPVCFGHFGRKSIGYGFFILCQYIGGILSTAGDFLF